MDKEVYSRIEDKIDKHTDMLISIKDDINKEISLIKLAHQKLKYITISLGVVSLLTLSIVKPKLAEFFKALL